MINLITGYEIRKEGRKEVLVLHLSYDVEFSLDFYKRKNGKSMKQLINDYIRNNKIRWNGNQILLLFGGVALGTLLLFSGPNHNGQMDYLYVNSVIMDSSTSTASILTSKPKEKEISMGEDTFISKEPTKIEESKEPEKKQEEITVNEVNSLKKVENNAYVEESSKKSEPVGVESQSFSTSSISSDQSQSVKEEDPVSNEEKITIYRSNGTVLTLSMNDYLIGVVASEMPASFPVEALKAQAIVARTYASKKLKSGGVLTDDVSTQVYKDESYFRSVWKKDFDFYYNKIRQAVLETDGMTVQYQGDYIEAIYHSTSNGKTEDAISVWGNSVPYLKSVNSVWDQYADTYLRTVEKDLSTVLQIFGIDFQEPFTMEVLSRNESGRISSIRVGNQSYTGVQFRNLLGLRSADFDIEIQDGKLLITTRGYGHGVGMSQYGAKGMAESGYSCLQILSHYYPGTLVTKE